MYPCFLLTEVPKPLLTDRVTRRLSSNLSTASKLADQLLSDVSAGVGFVQLYPSTIETPQLITEKPPSNISSVRRPNDRYHSALELTQ